MEFTNAEVNIEVLKQRAYNMRWAEVPEGVIPLTAADSDFPAAPEIGQALNDYISGRLFLLYPQAGLSLPPGGGGQGYVGAQGREGEPRSGAAHRQRRPRNGRHRQDRSGARRRGHRL